MRFKATRALELDLRSGRSVQQTNLHAAQLYDLLGQNKALPGAADGTAWKQPEAFAHWRENAFLPTLRSGMHYLLLLDQAGLWACLSYTASGDGVSLVVSDVQIRTSSQRDGVTLRQLFAEFAGRAKELPHASVTTYASRHNEYVCRLLRKAGFSVEAVTAKGVKFVVKKRELLRRARGTKRAGR